MENNCWNILNVLDLISAQWDICTASAERFYSAGAFCKSRRILVWSPCVWNCLREMFINKCNFKWINRQECFGLVSPWLRLQPQQLETHILNLVAPHKVPVQELISKLYHCCMDFNNMYLFKGRDGNIPYQRKKKKSKFVPVQFHSV